MGLKDPAMPDALEVEVRVRMVEEVQQPKPKPKVKKEPKGGSGVDNKGSGEKAPTHGLPPWGLLTKDGRKIGEDESKPWPERFTDLDGGTIQDLGEDRVCYNINYDNAFHRKICSTDDAG